MTVKMIRFTRPITHTEQTVIAAPPEAVWDYTQNYRRRPEWDPIMLAADVVAAGPAHLTRIQTRDGLRCTLHHRLHDRPARARHAMVEVESCWIAGGGGWWTYEPVDGGTRWTQTNTLVVKPGLPQRLVALLVVWRLDTSTRRAMHTVKARIEGHGAPATPDAGPTAFRPLQLSAATH